MTAAGRHQDRTQRAPSLRALEAVLSRMPVGELELAYPDGTASVFRGASPGPSARVTVNRPGAARRVLLGGSIGMAEGYLEGDWDTPDLAAVLDLGLANVQRANTRTPAPLLPVHRAWHRLRENTPAGARRNIAYHYDLGNDFYELWLDETMTYSSALYCDPADPHCPDLHAAQRAKWDRLLELLQPGRGDHLLEIGCGWGGFAIHAAREAGCRVTGVTISERQHAYAAERVARAGLEDRVDIRLQDYRTIPEVFSGIVSIEMFEAVGEQYWPVYFRRVRELLAAGGHAAIQTITIAEDRFEEYRSRPDFIQRYIFPGGMLPSPERFARAAQDVGLAVGEPLFFGQSYARTLEHWLERFESARDQVLDLGFDERFIRLWRYYLAYCRAGFLSGNVDVMQVRLGT